MANVDSQLQQKNKQAAALITIFICLSERKAEVRFAALKQEGNEFVKRGQYQDALGKYTECLKLKPEECAIYTNRLEVLLCFLSLSVACAFLIPQSKFLYQAGAHRKNPVVGWKTIKNRLIY